MKESKCPVAMKLDVYHQIKVPSILHAENIKHGEVKTRISKKCTRRVRKVLKTKLNGRNTIKSINSWYTTRIIDWTQMHKITKQGA